jgi:Ca2+-transporting ATPase
LFKIGPFGNKMLNIAALASAALVAILLFTPIGVAFGLVTLSAKLYFFALGLIFVPFVVMEICKLLAKKD